MLTVKKLLELPEVKGLKLVAGSAGLERAIGTVTVMEVPDIVKWLKGNDLLLTSFHLLKDDIDGQCKVLEDLAAASCACVAIKLGQYLLDFSPQLLETAERLGIAMLKIPYEMTYIHIINVVMEQIIEEKNRGKVMERYFIGVLQEDYGDTIRMLQRGKLLGLYVETEYFVAITIAFDSRYLVQKKDISLLQSIANMPQPAQTHHKLLSRISTNQSVSVFLSSVNREETEKHLRETVRMLQKRIEKNAPNRKILLGIGNISKGLEGIRDTFFNSTKALQSGEIFFEHQNVYDYAELEIYCELEELLAQNTTGAFEHVLEPIKNNDILDTLIAYFKCNANIGETAQYMGVHINTVKYRLQRVNELTGMDLKVYDDSFKLYMSILSKKIKVSKPKRTNATLVVE